MLSATRNHEEKSLERTKADLAVSDALAETRVK